MKKFTLLFVILLTFILVSCNQEKPKETVLKIKDYQGLKKYISEIVSSEMKKTNTVGLSIALIDGDKTILEEGFGFQDAEKSIKASSETLYRVASISKTFTALGVMQLDEKNQIDINNPITAYIPDFSIKDDYKNSEPVTLKNILTHHSGITSDNMKNQYHDVPPETILANLKEDERAYPADTILDYSNTGFTLAGLAIQNVSGIKYADYMKKNILEPLEMKNSCFYKDGIKNSLMSKPYDRRGVVSKELIVRDIPAAGLISSVHETSNYIKMLFNNGSYKGNKIIDPETLKMMWTSQNDNVKRDLGVKIGFSWMIENDKYIGKFVSHSGDLKNFHSFMMLSADHKIGVVIFANSQNSSGIIEKIGKDIFEKALIIKTGLKKEESESKKIQPADYDKSRFVIYDGYYAMPYFGLVKVEVKENRILVNLGDDAIDYFIKSDNLFHPEIKYMFNQIKEDKDMSQMNIAFDNYDNEKYLILEVHKGARILGLKVEKYNLSKEWENRLGEYESESDELKGLTLKKNDGYIVAKCDIKALEMKSEVVCRPINKNELLICGYGRGLNTKIKFVNENGEDVVYYSGIKFKKVIKIETIN